jgi:PIN domain nuclease of toxin-antitoxin system
VSACVADTHALIWFVLNDPRLSLPARTAMQNAAASGNRVFVPTISLVEIVYLIEKGRFLPSLLSRIVSALNDPLRGV